MRFLGNDKLAYAIGTLVISFLIIVFAEITPKVIGATYPERTALLLVYVLMFFEKLPPTTDELEKVLGAPIIGRIPRTNP